MMAARATVLLQPQIGNAAPPLCADDRKLMLRLEPNTSRWSQCIQPTSVVLHQQQRRWALVPRLAARSTDHMRRVYWQQLYAVRTVLLGLVDDFIKSRLG